MTREELIATVRKSASTTLFAYRMREALGLPQPKVSGKVKAKRGKRKQYRGARKLMRQRYGVNL